MGRNNWKAWLVRQTWARQERRCEVCGTPKPPHPGYIWQGWCTNGRCRDCCRQYCTAGGVYSYGHDRTWPGRVEVGPGPTSDVEEVAQ